MNYAKAKISITIKKYHTLISKNTKTYNLYTEYTCDHIDTSTYTNMKLMKFHLVFKQ